MRKSVSTTWSNINDTKNIEDFLVSLIFDQVMLTLFLIVSFNIYFSLLAAFFEAFFLNLTAPSMFFWYFLLTPICGTIFYKNVTNFINCCISIFRSPEFIIFFIRNSSHVSLTRIITLNQWFLHSLTVFSCTLFNETF